MHKLLVDDFCDTAFSLIAIHCRLEDYRMAYALNKHLNLKLKRCPVDLDIDNFSSSYAVYEWQEHQAYTSWHLISNSCRKEEDALQSSGSLFQGQQRILKTYHLIPELKQVDFLLKIQSEALEVNERKIVLGLQQIPQVITAYSIEEESIKSKDCLIIN